MQGGKSHQALVTLAGRAGPDGGHIAGFHPEVQLLTQRGREARGELDKSHRPTPARPRLNRLCQPAHDVEVTLDDRADAGTLHLDRHVGT